MTNELGKGNSRSQDNLPFVPVTAVHLMTGSRFALRIPPVMRPCLPLLATSFLICLPAAADSFVEWNPASDVSPDAVWRLPAEPVAADGPRLVVRDGHFFVGDKRYRVWGVNLSFGANLPEKEDAAKVADRLAAAGVNAVRMHHMDTAKFPRGLMHRDGGLRIDPEAFERLDFFIAELAKKGIRVNLNVHVGAHYSRMLDGIPEGNIKYDKIHLLYVPQIQQAWRDYARMLLEHRNPHRDGTRYADDPAVAWVEVTNENSFWFGNYLADVREGPAFYQEMLNRRFTGWLREQLGDDDGLAEAWNAGAQPLGDDLLAPFANQDEWRLERHGAAAVERSRTNAGVRITPTALSDQDWHLQYGIRPLKVEAGKYYTLQFRARADQPRKIRASVNMAHEPWGPLGLSEQAQLGPEWQSYRFGFTATDTDAIARLSFTFGDSKVPFDLSGIRLQPGGQVGVAEGESLEHGGIPLWGEAETAARSNDRLRFLAATEKAFFDMARGWIRDEIGCKAPVSGTQGYGPLGLYAQDGMDYIDTHAYWQHPRFPRKPWDPADWIVPRKAMVDHPQESTFLKLAAHRVKGRPFTVSEYNHPAPGDFQVECVPMMAAVAAMEDWDGVWFYTYEHDNDIWDLAMMTKFFDLRGNPAKWAFMPLGAALFREAGIAPAKDTFLGQLVPPTPQETWRDPAAAVARHRANTAGMGESPQRLAALLGGNKRPVTPRDGRGRFEVDGAGGAVTVGYGADIGATTNRISIESPEFCAMAVAALDGQGPDSSKRLLLVACGRAENQGMKFNDERTSVGRDWGQAPVRAEALTGSWRLPSADWRAWALKPDGTKGDEIPLETREGSPVLRMSPGHGTICYLLER